MKKNKLTAKLHFYIYFAITFFLIKLFVADVKQVSGISMEPELYEGDFVVILKAAYGIKNPFGDGYFIRWSRPKTDDILIYRMSGHYVVKRCAAGPDAILTFSDKCGYKIFFGNKGCDLTALQFRNLGGSAAPFIRKVPKNAVLAIGDNHSRSCDSRNYGFVLENSICGKVLLKVSLWK